MDELVIKKHDFELAKKRLKEFSQKKTKGLKIDTVKTSGGFCGLGNHKVTGDELNSRLSVIQDYLIDINNKNNETIKEFGQVYSALEALDKDYINAILISIKATEETSKRIETTQKQIKKIVDDQKKTLEVLKKFKQKLDSYNHLEDIDKIWNYYYWWDKESSKLYSSISHIQSICNGNVNKIDEVQFSLKNTENKIDSINKYLNEQITQLESTVEFTRELEKIIHLQDVDEMWESLSNANNSLQNVCNELNFVKDETIKQQSNIEKSLKFIESISCYEHLHHIDEIWNKTEVHANKLDFFAQQSESILKKIYNNTNAIEELVEKTDAATQSLANQITEIEKEGKETKNLVKKNKEVVDAVIEELSEKTDAVTQSLAKKIKYAYIIAGSSVGLALIELVIILLKVI